MTPGDVVTWQRYSGEHVARVLSVTKRTVTLDVCGVRVIVARGEVDASPPQQQETGR